MPPMPRTPITPDAARRNVAASMTDAADAAALVLDIIAGTSPLPADRHADALADAARILEAAGCQLRRRKDAVIA